MKKIHCLSQARPYSEKPISMRGLEATAKDIQRKKLSEYKRKLNDFKRANKDADLTSLACWMFVDASEATRGGTIDECLACAGLKQESGLRTLKRLHEEDVSGTLNWTHEPVDLLALHDLPKSIPWYIPPDIDKLIAKEEMEYLRQKGILLRQGITHIGRDEWAQKTIFFCPSLLKKEILL